MTEKSTFSGEKTMKAMTITIYFEDGKKPEGVTFGSIVNGGKVTAIAVYDMFKTMEIAEEALESSDCEICADAIQHINDVIAGAV